MKNFSLHLDRASRTTLIAFVFMALFGSIAVANNVQISGTPVITNQNTSAGANNIANSSTIQFNVSWDNSWNVSGPPGNWDAAWVFAKYRIGNSGPWYHAYLSTNDADYSVTTNNGTSVTVKPGTTSVGGTPYGMGVFIYRNTAGTGSINLSGVNLKWLYRANTVKQVKDNDLVTIQLYAVEMVYVTGGSYFLGSGGGEQNSFTAAPYTSGNSTPFNVTSESALTLGNSAGNLNVIGTSNGATFTAGTLAAAYPKGFAPFYAMKYELSLEAYADFINSLAYSQQNARYGNEFYYPNAGSGAGTWIQNDNGSNRAVLKVITAGNGSTPLSAVVGVDLNANNTCNEAADGQNVALCQVAHSDVLAYADWAGLRPMTELEFEKAARGLMDAVPNEYAWGDITGTVSTAYSNSGTSTEVSSTSGANFSGSGSGGPGRVGLYATASSSRSQAGASYFGILDLSGNVSEPVISAGDIGRSFTGLHGDGQLTNTGLADVTNWATTMCGHRGGAVFDNTEYLISNRRFISSVQANKSRTLGIRAVRTAQ